LLEIGTGRTINVPIGLWLCGASKIITVDINPYLKEELVLKSIEWMKNNETIVRKLFYKIINGDTFNNKLQELISLKADLIKVLKLCDIDYLASCNYFLNIKDKTIDCQFSINVFEHIPLMDIKSIFIETKRIMANDGFIVHIVDLSDHFSHSDTSITSINFLQFSEKEWNRWAGNKFMYHNRLRASEFYKLFNDIGLHIVRKEDFVDQKAHKIIHEGFPLDVRFAGLPLDDLAISRLSIVGKFQ